MNMPIPRRLAGPVLCGGLALALAACASSARQEVSAVVQDEGARQAAAQTAQAGEGSEAALKKGADAAAVGIEREPPTR